jgi:hypothetical protein
MRYVKYIGPSHVRQITARDWAGVGIQADTVMWMPQNGFAVPLDSLTEDQIRKAIEPDPYLVITGEDEDFTPQSTQTETVTPAMLEAGRVDITNEADLERAFNYRSNEGQVDDEDADRSTPRNTSGGHAPSDGS